MTWQEYQDAVGELFEQLEGIGKVSKNIYLPDRVTGGKRQIDVWIEMHSKNITFKTLIDAKFYKTKLDVKHVEEVMALAQAVNANKTVIVASNGWSEPAQRLAEHSDVDLMLLNTEDALDILVPEKWIMCPSCENDCIVLDASGGLVLDGKVSIFTVGKCRECKTGLAHCWDCGEKILLNDEEEYICYCEVTWLNTKQGIYLKSSSQSQFQNIYEAPHLI